jgi:hypothetical protein
MKKETLEEVAEKYASKIWDYSDSNEKTLHANCKKAFIKGAKWQQERSYSEEDLKTAFLDGWQLRDGDLPFSKAMKKWFDQFKKK